MNTSHQYLRNIAYIMGMLSASISQAQAPVQPGSAEAEVDWLSRSTASSSVLYATNFRDVYLDGVIDATRSSIASTNGLMSEAAENAPTPANITLDNVVTISGSNSIRLATLGSSGSSSGGSWSFRPDGRTSTVRDDVYVQFSVYYPRETIGYRFDHNGDSFLKTINFGQYGAGQVVVGDVYFSGFPTLLLNGTQTLGNYNYSISGSNNPWGSATTREQPAIDNGASPSSNDSKSEWLNNYGVMPRGTLIHDGDYSYNSSQPYLYERAGMTHGWPDNRAIQGGSVPWVQDGWTTIEAHLKYNGSNNSTIQVWAAQYGQEPRLIVNEVDSVPLGSNPSNAWNRFELLNYATGRRSESSRPTQYTYFDEVIVSTQPIQFPGGYSLPSESASPPSSGGGGSGGGSSPPPTNNDAPSWLSNISPGTWSAISNNTLADVDPADDSSVNPNYPNSAPWRGGIGQRGVIVAWNGGTFAPTVGQAGAFLMFGGGHGDYHGSEVYAFDMASATWSRLTDPYAGSGITGTTYSTGQYPDGSPLPMHTYDWLNYDPSSNSLVVLLSKTRNPDGDNQTTVPIAQMFDLDTLTWRRSPRASGISLKPGGKSCYDRNRQVFWTEGGSGSSGFASFDPSGDNGNGTFGSWDVYDSMLVDTDATGACDPVRDLFVFQAFRNTDDVWAIDLSDPNGRAVRLGTTGQGPAESAAAGFEWSETRQSFIYWRRGADVYELRPPSGNDWANDPWQWARLTDSGANTVTPQSMSNDNGVYSRFSLARYGNEEVATVVNRIDGPVYAFRIPSAVRPKPNTSMQAQ